MSVLCIYIYMLWWRHGLCALSALMDMRCCSRRNIWSVGLMDKASAPEAGDSKIESWKCPIVGQNMDSPRMWVRMSVLVYTYICSGGGMAFVREVL